MSSNPEGGFLKIPESKVDDFWRARGMHKGGYGSEGRRVSNRRGKKFRLAIGTRVSQPAIRQAQVVTLFTCSLSTTFDCLCHVISRIMSPAVCMLFL